MATEEIDVITQTVFVCSNPACGAVWATDPKRHCPECFNPNTGCGWSTMRRPLRRTPTEAEQENDLMRDYFAGDSLR